jgi:alkylated DNA nucleotide flippase Atl1
VRRIPPGFVATYGDLSPGAPRLAGRVLTHAGSEVPWWRVVRADGSLAKGARQLAMLAEEDVPLRGERVDMRSARIPAEAIL